MGAVTAACLADLGHTVCGVDINAARIAKLRRGQTPFHESNLSEVLKRNLGAGRLSFTTSAAEAVPSADFVLIAVDTPASDSGQADLSSLHAAARDVASSLEGETVVVIRSTVPPGTSASLAPLIRAVNPGARFDIVANPEFLREGFSVADFMRPDRIIIGADDRGAGRRVAGLYRGLRRPILISDLATAEMIKYASNSYLAASISFINEIANICDQVGADVSQVARALAMDKRIGRRAYLSAGIGFGGGCFPKDVSALACLAEGHGYPAPMLRAVMRVNELQPELVLARLKEAFADFSGLRVAVLGLSFKGGTFDLRSSPALAVVRLLAQEGIGVRVFDPLADESVPAEVAGAADISSDPYQAAAGCHALIIATEHPEFRELDLVRIRSSMKSSLLIDGRNLLDTAAALRAGFSYRGIGRGHQTKPVSP